MRSSYPISGDQKLVQIVNAALVEAARRSGGWLACRPGCMSCCVGIFRINLLDKLRLQNGLVELESRDPKRAKLIRQRARKSWSRLRDGFPGDPDTGMLSRGKEADETFETLGNDEPCPALDPTSGLCDLYESRPMTCRVFGPPVRSEGGLGTCELCFQGATDEEVAACEMHPDPNDLEAALLEKVENSEAAQRDTIVAFCLAT